jgi:hypothetical protein
MFVDPNAFNANEPGPPKSAGVRPPSATPSMLLESHGVGGNAADSAGNGDGHVNRERDSEQ